MSVTDSGYNQLFINAQEVKAMERKKIQSAYSLSEDELKRLSGIRPEVCFCRDFALQLCSDGTVRLIGGSDNTDVGGWKNIIRLSAGKKHIAALSADGHVLCTGDNSFGQCDTSGWKDICLLFTGEYITVGLDKDENAFIAGDFTGQDQTPAKKEQSPGIGYRMPEEDIAPYSSMVDFTNKILGTGKGKE